MKRNDDSVWITGKKQVRCRRCKQIRKDEKDFVRIISAYDDYRSEKKEIYKELDQMRTKWMKMEINRCSVCKANDDSIKE